VTYRLKGYAYSGGGRKITRVEISLNKGRSWILAELNYPEDRYREIEPQVLYGGEIDLTYRDTSFCWCFWHLDLPMTDIMEASDILVRSMDEAMNVQPRGRCCSFMLKLA
jgi:nitrate reductase (NAD(P)H)